jgi:hypothetical protein
MLQNFRLLTEQSLWLILPALLAGLGYAYILYYSTRKRAFSKRTNFVLFLLRFTAIALITGLLLGPFFRQSAKSVQQPKVVFLHDNTASLLAHDSLGDFAAKYLSQIAKVEARISDRMQPIHFVFGNQMIPDRLPDFNDERTDLSEALSQIPGYFYRQNVGAVVLLTDGIYNRGIDPLLTASEFPFPIYTVGLGDTTSYPDLAITDVRYNRVVWANSEFPIEVTTLARDAVGTKTTVSLFMDGNLIGRSEQVVGSDADEAIVNFSVKDAPPGQRRFVVQLNGIDNEKVTPNNRREFFVEVMGQQQRILILAAAPHPDLGTIRWAIDDYYDVQVAYLGSWIAPEKTPDLLVLHELPLQLANNEPLFNFIRSNPDVPIWFINGGRTDAAEFNRFQDVYRMRPFSQSTSADAFALPERTFGLFKIDSYQFDRFAQMPALNTQLSDWEVLAPAKPLLRQRLRGVETAYPLLSFYESPNRRMAFLMGTGLWRWRLAEYQRNGNNDAVNDLIRKTVNYLVIKTDERRLRLFTESLFSKNEEISFRAELFNQSMELVNDPELLMTITGNGVTYNYAFYRTDNSMYRLNIGRLPSGDYQFRAEVMLADEKLSREGRFTVSTDSPELRNIQANHQLLRSISKLSGGVFLHYDQIESLSQLINSDSRITSTARYSLRFSPVLGQLWALVLLLILLSAEWFLRKYLGAY